MSTRTIELHIYAEIDKSNNTISTFQIDHADRGFDNDPIFGKWEPGVVHGHHLPSETALNPHTTLQFTCHVPNCACLNTLHRYKYIGPSERQ